MWFPQHQGGKQQQRKHKLICSTSWANYLFLSSFPFLSVWCGGNTKIVLFVSKRLHSAHISLDIHFEAHSVCNHDASVLGEQFLCCFESGVRSQLGWIGWGRGGRVSWNNVVGFWYNFDFSVCHSFAVFESTCCAIFPKNKKQIVEGWSNQHEQVLFYTPTPSLCSLWDILLIHLQSVPPNHPFSASDRRVLSFLIHHHCADPAIFLRYLSPKIKDSENSIQKTQLVGWLIWIQAKAEQKSSILKRFTLAPVSLMFFLIWFQSIFINGKHRDSQLLICLRVPAIDFCGLSPNWPQFIWDGTRRGDAAICGLSAYEISEGFDHCNCKLIQICPPVLNGTDWITIICRRNDFMHNADCLCLLSGCCPYQGHKFTSPSQIYSLLSNSRNYQRLLPIRC